MRVCVQLFAAARQRAGRPTLELDLPAGTTVRQLRRAMLQSVPELAAMLPHCLIAVDSDYAPDEQVIGPAAQVACIPPVSGG